MKKSEADLPKHVRPLVECLNTLGWVVTKVRSKNRKTELELNLSTVPETKIWVRTGFPEPAAHTLRHTWRDKTWPMPRLHPPPEIVEAYLALAMLVRFDVCNSLPDNTGLFAVGATVEKSQRFVLVVRFHWKAARKAGAA